MLISHSQEMVDMCCCFFSNILPLLKIGSINALKLPNSVKKNGGGGGGGGGAKANVFDK